MELQHLHHPSCPTCNSDVRTIEQDRKHTNGSWFESMTFQCGAVIEFSPNFMMEQDRKLCPNHPEEYDKNEKRREAKRRLINYINKLPVDNKFKKYAIMHLPYVKGE